MVNLQRHPPQYFHFDCQVSAFYYGITHLILFMHCCTWSGNKFNPFVFLVMLFQSYHASFYHDKDSFFFTERNNFTTFSCCFFVFVFGFFGFFWLCLGPENGCKEIKKKIKKKTAPRHLPSLLFFKKRKQKIYSVFSKKLCRQKRWVDKNNKNLQSNGIP